MLNLLKKMGIGKSQFPQIASFIVGLALMMMFLFKNENAYAFLAMLSVQAGCIFATIHNEHEDEKKANEEAFAMLENH